VCESVTSGRSNAMRVLMISLNTYSAPYNDGKLAYLGPRLGALTVVTGDIGTLWGHDNRSRSGPGYEVIVLPLRYEQRNATARLQGLYKVAESVQPTIIHVECEPWQRVAVQSLKLAQQFKIPIGILFAETGPRLNGYGGALRRSRGSWVLRRCDYAVGWSTASTRIAQRLAPGIRTETFPGTGVTVSADSTASPADWFGENSVDLPKLAFVGRFAAEKGVRDFLEICDRLVHHMPLRAALAGGDDETVRRWVDTRPWAFLHGVLPRPQVSSLLSAADILVSPSRTTNVDEEQFGKAAVEAMAAGTPVFAYDCGALPETIGTGGLTVPQAEQDQLAKELEEYFALAPATRSELVELARGQAKRFTDETLATKLIDLWSSIA
jgi:glycosyltransferase involved in cell wall biosynthesis